MARGRIKSGRQSTEIADAILAEWYRILPPANAPGAAAQMDANALTAAFNSVLDPSDKCQVILDEPGKPIKIVVPLPPAGVKTKEDLLGYIQKNDDFRQGMGAAVLFGCGR
ncbi:hypothetical protein [Rhizobium sp. RAF56]|uniref:hypothetical protein n=1 Tax=Rhizobium sp. RAF56 TaxID=3233062 RepID=UPI003F9D6B1A